MPNTGHPASVHANTVTWYLDYVHNQTVVQADVNGNAVADLEIHQSGLKTLTATDFIV